MAHLGSVGTLDWHPRQADVLLTGGQDKMIKVWNIQQPQKELYQIKTQSSIRLSEWIDG